MLNYYSQGHQVALEKYAVQSLKVPKAIKRYVQLLGGGKYKHMPPPTKQIAEKAKVLGTRLLTAAAAAGIVKEILAERRHRQRMKPTSRKN